MNIGRLNLSSEAKHLLWHLRTKGPTEAYYSIGSVSVGLQAGAQSKAIVILFMNHEVLQK